MGGENLKDMLALQKLEEKIFKYKSMYHPNLVANLSREAYDLYLIRNSIGDQLLEVIKKKGRSLKKIKEFITEKIHEIETKLKQETIQYELNLLKISIDEWKAFL